jgi:hypothetical protein
MATKKHFTGGNPVVLVLFLGCCSFLGCFLVYNWFENKVPSFAHLGGKDEKNVSCCFLHAPVHEKNHRTISVAGN